MRTGDEFQDALRLEDESVGDFDEEDIDSLVDDAIDELDEDIDYLVFGSDDRFQIRAQRRHPSTTQFPFNTICFLERVAGTGFRSCTGTLIAPQVVLTARHCLRNNIRIRVTPGADFSATSVGDRRPATPPDMIADSRRFRVDTHLDYGVIILPRPFSRPSRVMMLQPRSTERTATLLTLAGYPSDKPRGTLWAHSGRIPITGVTSTHLFYRLDTAAGQSGAPLWLLGNDGIRLLLGIHRGGNGICHRPGAPAGGENCAVRITCDVINNIIRWCRAFGVTGPMLDQRVYRQQCPAA